MLQLNSRTERVMDVRDVRELRAVLSRARSDPDVIGWRYWRVPELPPVRSACSQCDTQYEPGQVNGRVCRCGSMHIKYECRKCRATETDPVYREGCGSIPFDLEGVNEKYHRRSWRRSA